MKKTNKILLFLSLLLLLFPMAATTKAMAYDNSSIVDIPDANLKSALLTELNKGADYSITVDDMKSIDSLYAYGKKISSIEGLQYCTNLKTLDLDYNSISDISPLKNLTNLQTLYLIGNKISDISYLSALKNLNVLFLINNEISDLTPLSSLTNLGWLCLSNNKITDISPLASLTNVYHLTLNMNSISDLTPLKNLTNLNFLEVNSNKFTDYSPILSLTNLSNLFLEHNNIDDISGLSSLTNLVKLDLAGNNIQDISSLRSLTKLQTLYLNGNYVYDVSPLKDLKSLVSLDLSLNYIYDITPLYNLSSLESLDLENQIIVFSSQICKGDISIVNPIEGAFISNISNNGTYDASSNKVNWTGLTEDVVVTFNFAKKVKVGSVEADFTGIAGEYVYVNPVIVNIEDENFRKLLLESLGRSYDDVITQKDLEGVTYLDASNSGIKSLKGIEYFTNLEDLNLSGNEISDISSLKNLPKLKNADVTNQTISLPRQVTSISFINISCTNPLISYNAAPVTSITYVSDNGFYSKSTNKVKWQDINKNSTLFYNFEEKTELSSGECVFSGKVTKEISFN